MKNEDRQPLYEHIIRQIDGLSYDMNCDLFDGWYKEKCRNTLREIRDHINKALEQ
jgi:hypothetical protein